MNEALNPTMKRVRIVPVVVCAIVHFMLGAAWFTAFSVPWQAGAGKTMDQLKQQGSAGIAYSTAFVASLVMAYVLAQVIATGEHSTAAGVRWGVTLGIGVAFAALVTEMIFEARPLSFMLITAGLSRAGHDDHGRDSGRLEAQEGVVECLPA